MAPSQKKAANTITKIDLFSSRSDFMDSRLFTVGFGGLYLSKGGTNCSRNFVLHLDGERFGLNILRAIKNGDDSAAEMMSTIKNAVFVAKDRQSDYLSYMTTGETVPKALSLKDNYNVIRCPEKILLNTDNAKKQKRIIFPVAIQCNVNGDVFILDSGSFSLHVVDNSTVAKMYEIGNYKTPNLKQYPECKNKEKMTAKNAQFGNHLSSMVMVNDDLYVADVSRNEILVIRQCHLAKDVEKSKIHVIKSGACLSLSYSGGSLVTLQDQVIEIICVELPDSKKYSFKLAKKVLQTISPSTCICGLFLLTISDKTVFGAISKENKVWYYTKENNTYSEILLSVRSEIIPCCTPSSNLVILPTGGQLLHQLSILR